jgi:hypothetical protein
MRLIDADRLIAYMNDYALQESPLGYGKQDDYDEKLAAYEAIQDCVAMVEEAETVK